MFMEAMLGISLYSYPHRKLAKMLYLIISSFLCNELGKSAEQVLPGSKGCEGKEEEDGDRG
jgi:hypothetical protein